MSAVLSAEEMQRDVKTLRHSHLIQHHEFVCMLRAVDKHSHSDGAQFTHQATTGPPQNQRAKNLQSFYSILLRMLVELSKRRDQQKQRQDLKRVFDWFGVNKVLFADPRDAQSALSLKQRGHRNAEPDTSTQYRSTREMAGEGRQRNQHTPTSISTTNRRSPPPSEGIKARVASQQQPCPQENFHSSMMIKRLNNIPDAKFQMRMPATTRVVRLESRSSSRSQTSSQSQTSLTASFLSRSTSPSGDSSALPPVSSCSPPPPNVTAGSGFEVEPILDSFSTVRLPSTTDIHFTGDQMITAAKSERYSRHAQQEVPPLLQDHQPHSMLRNRSPVTAQTVYGMVNTVTERMTEMSVAMENRFQKLKPYGEQTPVKSAGTGKDNETVADERKMAVSPHDRTGGSTQEGMNNPESTAAPTEADHRNNTPLGNRARKNKSKGQHVTTERTGKSTGESEVKRVTLALPSHVTPPPKSPRVPRGITRKPYQQRLWHQLNRPGSATSRVSYPDINGVQSTPNLTYMNTKKSNIKRRQAPAPPKTEAIQSLMVVSSMERTSSAKSPRTRTEKRKFDDDMEGHFFSQRPMPPKPLAKFKPQHSPEGVPAEYVKFAESMRIEDRYPPAPSPPAASQVSLDRIQSDAHLPMTSQEAATFSYLTAEEGPQAPPASAATFERGSVISNEFHQSSTCQVLVEVNAVSSEHKLEERGLVIGQDDKSQTELEHRAQNDNVDSSYDSLQADASKPDADAEYSNSVEAVPGPEEKKDVPHLLISAATIDEPDIEPALIQPAENDEGSKRSTSLVLALEITKNRIRSSSCSDLPDTVNADSNNTPGSHTTNEMSPKVKRSSRRGSSPISSSHGSPSSRRKRTSSKSPLLPRRLTVSDSMGLRSRSDSHIAMAFSSPRRSSKTDALADQQRREKAARVVQTNLRKFLAHKKRMAKHLTGRSIRAEQKWTEEELAEQKEFEARKHEKVEEEKRRRAREAAQRNKLKKELQNVQAHSDIQTIFRPAVPSAKERRHAATCLQKIVRGFLQRRAMRACYLLTAEPGIPALPVLIKECKTVFAAVQDFHSVKKSARSVPVSYRELKLYTGKRLEFQKAYSDIANSAESTSPPGVVCIRELMQVFAGCDKAPSWKEVRTAARAVLARHGKQMAELRRKEDNTDSTADDESNEASNTAASDAEEQATESDEELAGEGEDETETPMAPVKSVLLRLDATELTREEFLELAFLIYVPIGSGVTAKDARKSTWLNPLVDGEDTGVLSNPAVLQGTDLQRCLDLVAQSRQERQERQEREQ